jgi:hypothetical protein
MFSSPHQFILTMATVLFLSGLVTLVVGVVILTSQAIGQNVKTIATQVTKLAQKGISEDISGLVGNASSLLAALDQLVRSTAGIGIILLIVSFILFGASYGLIIVIK